MYPTARRTCSFISTTSESLSCLLNVFQKSQNRTIISCFRALDGGVPSLTESALSRMIRQTPPNVNPAKQLRHCRMCPLVILPADVCKHPKCINCDVLLEFEFNDKTLCRSEARR